MDSHVVHPEEIDLFIQSIRKFQVEDIGTKYWLDAHERLLKLNQQATIEASSHREEVVKDMFIIHDKLEVLVHEAYCILVWRCKVFKKLVDRASHISATFFLYTVLYHELIAVSLLENVLYHESSCENLGEIVIDLIDYCVQAITQLIGLCHSGFLMRNPVTKEECNTIEELKFHEEEISFIIGIKCVTILSYLSDKIGSLSTSAARRLTQTHDVPCLLSELLSLRPWLRRIKNFEKFIDCKWVSVEGDEILKVGKVEAQCWFCLRSIIFHRETFECYEINSFRQRELGKCSGLLNDVVLDQLPPLAELKQFLCSLQLSSQTSNNLNSLYLEVIPEVTTKIIFV
jgi:zinc finger MYND domain-containing protein 10